MAAIVKARGNDGTEYYYGPFTNGEQATSWAYNNLKGFEWQWEDLIRAGSTYLTTCPEDIEDFARTLGSQDKDCYITIDDANWVIPAQNKEV